MSLGTGHAIALTAKVIAEEAVVVDTEVVIVAALVVIVAALVVIVAALVVVVITTAAASAVEDRAISRSKYTSMLFTMGEEGCLGSGRSLICLKGLL